MKKLLPFLLILISSQSFSQVVNSISWYKMISGKIDRYPVEMHLHKSGHFFTGFYYFDSQQQPIYFIGEDTTAKGVITLLSFTEEEGTERFSFTIAGKNGNGVWVKDEKSKPLSFTFSEVIPPIGFDYIFTKGATQLRPKLKNSPQATFEAASVWPKGEGTTASYIKNIIRQSFDTVSNAKEDIGGIFLRKKKEIFGDYQKENVSVKDIDLAESAFAFNLDETARLLVAYQSKKILTLAYYNYLYSGGAHGNYGTTYTCIDLINNKKLTLSDVLSDNSKASIRGLLEKNFRKTRNLQATASLEDGGLFENKIEPNENFYITEKGVGFSYTPYEIAPYAMGEINIFIPFQELVNYVQPAFLGLMGWKH